MKDDTLDFFKIQGGTYEYFVSIRTKYSFEDDSPISYGIDLGGKMKGCVTITVQVPNEKNKKNERLQVLEQNKKIAFISWIGYNHKCSITKPFPGGTSTRHMVKTAMTFICNRYKWIQQFSLIDDSNVPCIQGISANLAYLSIVTNGKTYYEKYLSAYIQTELVRTEYKNNIKRLFDPNQKLIYEDFINIFDIKQPHPQMQESYKSKITYIEFFKDFKQKTGNDFCKIVMPWIQDFIIHILEEKYNYWMQKWVIDKNTIQFIDIGNTTDISKIVPTEAQSQENFVKFYMNNTRGGNKKTASAMFSLQDID